MSECAPVPSLADAARRACVAAGGGAQLARQIGVTRFAVQQWLTNAIPAARVPAVSRVTGIPMHQLRPDLFDVPHDSAAASVAVPHIPAMQAAE